MKKYKRKFTANSLEAETLMPDGRPLFAWENQLAMATKRIATAEAMLKEAKIKMQLLKIAEIEMEQSPEADEIVVRFKTYKAIKDRDFENNLIKHYERV